MDELHHPAPRLPEGWKQFQADNIDVTTISDVPTNNTTSAGMGRHSRSPSVLSNHGAYSNTSTIIQPSQIEHHSLNTGGSGGNNLLGDDDIIYGNSDDGGGSNLGSILDPQFPSEQGQQQQQGLMSSHFPHSSSLGDEFDFRNHPQSQLGNSSVVNSSYFGQQHDNTALSTATQNLNGVVVPGDNLPLHHHHHHRNANSNTANMDDYYLSSTDPASSSPFLNPSTTTTTTTNTDSNTFASSTSPPLLQDPFTTYQPENTFHHPPTTTSSTYDTSTLDTNTLGLHWSHHRTRSDQSDISSNAASPFIGSVHSDHGSPFINAQQDNSLEDDLHEALLGLDMGAPQFDVAAQYNPHNYDTSNLELDNSGFPLDAQPLFPQSSSNNNTASDRQEYYEHTSRPGSSSSYHHPPSSQSIFQYPHPHNIQTSIPPSFQSPPLPSATSIPEIEVTVAPPTPRTQAFINIESYFPQPYHHQHHQHRQQGGSNSPSIPPSYTVYPPDLPALALPSPQGPNSGRRRAVSDSGTRPTFAMLPPSNPNALVRRVSSGSHPYLAVHESSASSSGRSSPSRGHRKSFSHGGHNMTHREVMELVKNEGPREAKNPKKFVCDYPGCGQRFTRNSNKTYGPYKLYIQWMGPNLGCVGLIC